MARTIQGTSELFGSRATVCCTDIVVLMMESNLKPGKQRLQDDLAGFNRNGLRHGVSVTDECLGWKKTEKLVAEE